MKKLLLTAASAALLTAAQAHATVYNITYDYLQQSAYTASKVLVGGTPDPTNAVNSTMSGGSPLMSSIGAYGVAAPVSGTGWLDTSTGQIYLNPTDIEITVVGGSYGFVGWSQTLNGSFSGNSFTMTGATVNGGSKVCELATSSGCLSGGGVGSAPAALLLPQSYTPAVYDEDGIEISPATVTPIPVGFDFIGTGGHGQYLNQDSTAPAFASTTLNFTIGSEVSQVPVPAAAWLFGSGLLGLAGVGRKRRS